VSVHHCWWGPHAQWITWAGVAIAVAGVLIAVPDAILLPAWRRAKDAGSLARTWLARSLPFLREATRVELKESRDAGTGTERVSVIRRMEWNDRARARNKIEVLHHQVEQLRLDVADVRQEIARAEAALSSALQRAEARRQDEYRQLTGRVEARERRAARVDSYGICPIMLGIVLTGIPGELADIAVIGWASIIAGFAVTLCAAKAVMTDQGT